MERFGVGGWVGVAVDCVGGRGGGHGEGSAEEDKGDGGCCKESCCSRSFLGRMLFCGGLGARGGVGLKPPITIPPKPKPSAVYKCPPRSAITRRAFDTTSGTQKKNSVILTQPCSPSDRRPQRRRSAAEARCEHPLSALHGDGRNKEYRGWPARTAHR